jgi:tRNA modification GTPase
VINKNKQSTPTIVACATAPGQSAIAIVRMSGTRSIDIVNKIWKPISSNSQKPRELVLGWLIDDGNNIDQAMVVNMPSPKSYTGEDIVEIHLHGSMAIVHKAIQLCIKNGAQLAENGEFSKRAYLNGKLDLSQAEAVSELISSSNARMMRLASKQLAGEFSRNILNIKSELLSTAAHLSATLDFSEEDIEAQEDSTTQSKIDGIRDKVNQLLEGSDNLAVVREGFHVVFIGLPNAGKSTLLNKLVGYDRSIVTEIAGTTRDTITEPIMLNDSIIQITDTAGLHSSRDKVEKLGIKRTLQEIKNSDFVLILVEPDSLVRTQKFLEDNNISKYLDVSNCLVVFTKSDTKSTINHKESSKDVFFNDYKSIDISTKTGQGIKQLKEIISHNSNKSSNQSDLKLLTNRQIVLLKKLDSKLNDISSKLKNKTPSDILAVEVQSAIAICNEITGEETTQEIIDEVFSNFCIGK